VRVGMGHAEERHLTLIPSLGSVFEFPGEGGGRVVEAPS